MALLSLTLPSSDAYVTMIETLTQIMLTSSRECSVFLQEMISHEYVANEIISTGVFIMFFMVINQCKLPTHTIEDEDGLDYRITETRFASVCFL